MRARTVPASARRDSRHRSIEVGDISADRSRHVSAFEIVSGQPDETLLAAERNPEMADRTNHRLTSQCEGKQGFETFKRAESAAKRIRKFNGERGPIAIYRCSWCPSWHIGSKPRGRKSK